MTDPRTIYISAKCHNNFSLGVIDVNKRLIASYHGYVPSFLPNAGGKRKYVQMEIDMETGQILNWKNPIEDRKFTAIFKDAAEGVPKTIYISAYCPNMFEMSVMDANWQEIASHDGYVPSFMPNEGGYGDHVQMEIDIETGEILDWENPIGDSEFDKILEDAKIVPTTISFSAGCDFSMIVLDTNGKFIVDYDGPEPSFMPGGGGDQDFIVMEFDLWTGQVLGWKNPIGHSEFNAILGKKAAKRVPKTISISGKCSDRFSMGVMDSNGKCIAEYDGYVPSFIPGRYGDYVDILIDVETGRIINWKNPIRDKEFIDILHGRVRR